MFAYGCHGDYPNSNGNAGWVDDAYDAPIIPNTSYTLDNFVANTILVSLSNTDTTTLAYVGIYDWWFGYTSFAPFSTDDGDDRDFLCKWSWPWTGSWTLSTTRSIVVGWWDAYTWNYYIHDVDFFTDHADAHSNANSDDATSSFDSARSPCVHLCVYASLDV